MKFSRCLAWAIVVSGISVMSWSGAQAETAQEAANKQLVIGYFAAIDRLDTLDARDFKEQASKALAKYVRPDYIQHNESFARFGQGSAGLIQMFESRRHAGATSSGSGPAPQNTSRVLAVMADGEMVIRVNSLDQGDSSKSPLVIFNLFRIQDGLIAEHWDGASGGRMPGQ